MSIDKHTESERVSWNKFKKQSYDLSPWLRHNESY